MRKAIPLVIGLYTTAFLPGCGESPDKELAQLSRAYQPSPDTDVSGNPSYRFKPFYGTIWTTRVETAVADMRRYTGAPETALFVPERFDSKHPRYTPVRNMKLITVLPMGSRIRIAGLMKDNGVAGGVQVVADLGIGTNTQKGIYLDAFLFTPNRFMLGPTTVTNWSVNPEFLGAIAENQAERSTSTNANVGR